jgi:hypothetical protein
MSQMGVASVDTVVYLVGSSKPIALYCENVLEFND